MKLLLDTHALVWWLTDDPRLPAAARAAIAAPDNQVFVSAATAWEITTKHRLGKWPEVQALIDNFEDLLRRARFLELPITLTEARLAGSLDGPHGDPFDRMLVAQSRAGQLTLVSLDGVFADYAVPTIWG